MFVKTTRRRRGDKVYEYLSLVESVRDGSKVGHRTLLRLGEVTALRESGQLERIAAALKSHMRREDSVRDTWNDVAVPVLRTLQDLEGDEDGNAWGADIDVLTERLRMDPNQIGPQLESLEHAGYISVQGNAQTLGNPNRHYGIKLLPGGRRELGEWPADPMAALAAALARTLEEAGAVAASEEERSRFKALTQKLRETGPAIGLAAAAEAAEVLLGMN